MATLVSGWGRAVLVVVGVLVAVGAGAQEGVRARAIVGTEGVVSAAGMVELGALVEEMRRSGELRLLERRADRSVAGRVHEGFEQRYRGVRVLGGGVSRQRAGGETVSVFGTIYEGIGLDVAPAFSPGEALARLEARAGVGAASGAPPELLVLPTWRGGTVLAYRAAMRDVHVWFLDAGSGAVLFREPLWDEQAAVGSGVGILDRRKKLSVSRDGEDFLAWDLLRPAEIVTLDLRYAGRRTDELLFDPEARWTVDDVARDDNNDWRDPSVVDVHAYLGATYDYLLARQRWNGLDGDGGRILGMVNIAPILANAFYAPPPFGPEGTGVVAFSKEDDGTPLTALDIVAHEAMHGVTFHGVHRRTGSDLLPYLDILPGPASFEAGGQTFRCGETYTALPELGYFFPGGEAPPFEFACAEGRLLLFAETGGAVNEAYSDIVATAVEFAARGPDGGNYTMGEDLGVPIRSLEDPGSLPLVPVPEFDLTFPDAAGGIVRFLVFLFEDEEGEEFPLFSPFGSVDGETIITLPSVGYTGVHWNSTVLSHAFYLAVEGGVNRTTGLAVEGVGADGRADVERAFFRAMTDLMPPLVDFRTAAAVIRQSAADLFGMDSPTLRAVDEALRAVGL